MFGYNINIYKYVPVLPFSGALTLYNDDIQRRIVGIV